MIIDWLLFCKAFQGLHDALFSLVFSLIENIDQGQLLADTMLLHMIEHIHMVYLLPSHWIDFSILSDEGTS